MEWGRIRAFGMVRLRELRWVRREASADDSVARRQPAPGGEMVLSNDSCAALWHSGRGASGTVP
ncbi:hypothetical protein GCM10010195_65330 [Kitasatospora griseola]|nr:hypothetical protein GCM10010195_65330 [Kitasatospora griseola]